MTLVYLLIVAIFIVAMLRGGSRGGCYRPVTFDPRQGWDFRNGPPPPLPPAKDH